MLAKLALAVVLGMLGAQFSPAAIIFFPYVVENANDSGPGSLRQAMLQALLDGRPSRIIFSGPHHIQPLSPLVGLEEGTTIDGSSQIQANGEPGVTIDGSQAGLAIAGINIQGSNCLIQNLAIVNWEGNGVRVAGLGGSRVVGCVIRGNESDEPLSGNGIYIDDSPNNIIGGPTSPERNVISGNEDAGILIFGNLADGNRIVGNRIGTDFTGMLANGNGRGVSHSTNTEGTVIGGPNPGEGNLISGNRGGGISLNDDSTVQGNIIGLAVDGQTPLPNARDQFSGSTAVSVSGNGNLIGGPSPFVAGLGTGPLGPANVIAGNRLSSGVSIFGDNNIVMGNLIGVCADGVTPAGNGTGNGSGVGVSSGTGNQIGGPGSGEANVIAASDRSGVVVGGDSNKVWGNVIGMDVTRTRPLGNLFGVSLSGTLNLLGGSSPELGNLIAGNRATGVRVTGTTTGGLISRNSIHSNGGLGIDLNEDGVTQNDPLDADDGPNLLQNFPVSLEAHFESQPPRVVGALNSTPNSAFFIELYVSESPDQFGHGEGQFFLDSLVVATGADGSISWQHELAPPLPPGRHVTATATTVGTMNTSEFSPSVVAIGREPAALEIVEALLGIIPLRDDHNVNADGAVDAADVVTQENAAP